MGLKPDHWIRMMALEHGMIEPFVDRQVREGVISYGLSSYGYDVRAADRFKVLAGGHAQVVDPKQLEPQAYVDFQGDVCVVPPNSFALAESVERVRIPRDVTGLVLCKSTYVRAGVLTPTTVLEAGWEGTITLAVVNTTPLPVRVYAHEGIAQVLFFTGDGPCDVSYADRRGKYQNQSGVVPPRV